MNPQVNYYEEEIDEDFSAPFIDPKYDLSKEESDKLTDAVHVWLKESESLVKQAIPKRKYGSIKFPIEAGMFVRNDLQQYLDSEKFMQEGKLNISYTISKGFFSSLFLIQVQGYEDEVMAWFNNLKRIMAKYNSD